MHTRRKERLKVNSLPGRSFEGLLPVHSNVQALEKSVQGKQEHMEAA